MGLLAGGLTALNRHFGGREFMAAGRPVYGNLAQGLRLSIGRDRAIPTGYQAGGAAQRGHPGPGRVGRYDQPIGMSSA